MNNFRIFKAITALLFFVSDLSGYGQTYSYINIYATTNTIGSSAVVNVFLNEELAGRLGEMENLQCKVFSKGRVTITITYPDAYIRKATNIDIEKGKSYYMHISSGYAAISSPEDDFKILEGSFKKTLKFEEDYHSPVVSGTNTDDDGPGQGTCFLISKKGYVLTNYHVIRNAKTIQIKGVEGDFSTLYGADVVAVDIANDLALVKFKSTALAFQEPPFTLTKSSCEQGSKAFVLGYPMAKSMGEEIKLTDGLISAKSGYKGSISQYQFSAPVQPGNSGSPLFNETGDVIGIASAKFEGAENAGYAVKSQYLLTFMGLVDNFVYTSAGNQVKALSLNDKVTKLKNFIYIIKTEEE